MGWIVSESLPYSVHGHGGGESFADCWSFLSEAQASLWGLSPAGMPAPSLSLGLISALQKCLPGDTVDTVGMSPIPPGHARPPCTPATLPSVPVMQPAGSL